MLPEGPPAAGAVLGAEVGGEGGEASGDGAGETEAAGGVAFFTGAGALPTGVAVGGFAGD